MVDRNVENNEEILLAQIDPTGCPSGKILEYRDADERLQEHFFDCWQNPLEWRPKQGKRPSSYRVVRGTGYSIWAYDEALNLRWGQGRPRDLVRHPRPRQRSGRHIFYYPQEATPERGPTLFLPGSHLVPVARVQLGHFGNLAGQVMTSSPAGSVFLTACSIWHRQPPKRSADVRNLLKWQAWRTTPPQRDWIIEADLNFATADFTYSNEYFSGPSQTWQSVLRTSELFMWL